MTERTVRIRLNIGMGAETLADEDRVSIETYGVIVDKPGGGYKIHPWHSIDWIDCE